MKFHVDNNENLREVYCNRFSQKAQISLADLDMPTARLALIVNRHDEHADEDFYLSANDPKRKGIEAIVIQDTPLVHYI
jgi:hypothetical protein